MSEEFVLTAEVQSSIVSLYPHIKIQRDSEYIEIDQLMILQKEGYWKEHIDGLLAVVATGNEKAIESSKQKIPYYTGSGSFNERNSNGLICHSGKMVIDFDKLEKYTTIQEARKVLEADKYTEYCFLSCTRRGLAVVVEIDPAKHSESFLYLEKYYKDKYGLTIDKSCKDVTRARFVTYDPDLFHNPNYMTVYVPAPTQTVDTDEGKYEWVLKSHNKRCEFIEGNRHHYLVVLAFFCNKVGISQSYTLSKLTSDFSGPEKTPKEINQIVTHCYKNTADFGTLQITKKLKDLPPEFSNDLKRVYAAAHDVNKDGRQWNDNDIKNLCSRYYLAEDIVRSVFISVFENHADEFDLNSKPDIEKIEHYIRKNYEVLRNEVSGRVEYRPKNSNQNLKNLNPDTILRDLMHKGFKITLDKLKSLLRSDFVEDYNPFLKYFNSLPEWDSEDHIAKLAGFIKTDNQEFWTEQFKKALVRNIACSCYGYNNRIIITLVGEDQEKGKSSFIKFLCPPQLHEYYTEDALDFGKDSILQMSENFIWNLEEMAGMENHEVNKLKATISRSSIKQRRAYAEFAESRPRRANFWASTNKTDFLTDDQNTRWLCFNVTGIDFGYNNLETGSAAVDINDVWAQAWALYHSGYQFRLTKEEARERDKINKLFEKGSSERDLLLEHYRPCQAKFGDFVTATQIMNRLQDFTDNKIKLNVVGIGKALRTCGFKSDRKNIQGQIIRGWWVTRLGTENGLSQNIDFETPKTGGAPEKKPF